LPAPRRRGRARGGTAAGGGAGSPPRPRAPGAVRAAAGQLLSAPQMNREGTMPTEAKTSEKRAPRRGMPPPRSGKAKPAKEAKAGPSLVIVESPAKAK